METYTWIASVMVTERSLAISYLSVFVQLHYYISTQNSNVAKRGHRLTTDSTIGEKYAGFTNSLVKSITRPWFNICAYQNE